jgi:hypothetical protein
MTPQATNKREGDLASCCGNSQKLKTMKAAQKLVGTRAICKG